MALTIPHFARSCLALFLLCVVTTTSYPQDNSIEPAPRHQTASGVHDQSSEELRAKSLGSDDTEAVLSRWLFCKQQFLAGTSAKDAINNFIGFLEGRLHIEVSRGFEESLHFNFARLQADEALRLANDMVALRQLADLNAGLHVKAKDGQARVFLRGSMDELATFKTTDKQAHVLGQLQFAFLNAGKDLFVADLLKSEVDGFQLHCVDVGAKRIRWSAAVTGTPHAPGGKPIEFIEITANESTVCVFGCGNVVFCETFRRADGRGLFAIDLTHDAVTSKSK